MKIAFLFSGQGAQYPGMFSELCEESHAAWQVMETADRTLGRPISGLCFHGTQEELRLTHNTQPCVLACDLAAAAALTEQGIKPDGVAGFSLGEYAALVTAGVMMAEDVFPLIQVRADAMQEAVLEGTGGMAALMLDGAAAENLCREVKGEVYAANYNCPVQTVVSGTTEGIDEIMALAEMRGIRAIRLQVSTPNHCDLMRPAEKSLKERLDNISVREPSLPIYMNATGEQYRPADVKEGAEGGLRSLILQQVYRPLLWMQIIEAMERDGFDTFIECGPGKTLTGLTKRILKGKSITLCRVEDRETLRETIAIIRERQEEGICEN